LVTVVQLGLFSIMQTPPVSYSRIELTTASEVTRVELMARAL